MSQMPHNDPALGDAHACDAIDMVIVPRAHDIGGFAVRRALPAPRRQMVGPFIFLDQMGPADFVVGEGIDVRPHPHIGLSTLTYLHDGEIIHRDSLGTEIAIRPGAVNWMTAGRGIAHSERSGKDFRAAGGRLGGLQMWVALRAGQEEREPAFIHHGADALPVVEGDGSTARIVAGRLFGATSPLADVTDAIFADVEMLAGSKLPLDADDGGTRHLHRRRAKSRSPANVSPAGRLLVFRARRQDHDDRDAGFAFRGPRRPDDGRAPSHLVEFRLVPQGPDRGGQGGLESRAVRRRARRERVYPAARMRASDASKRIETGQPRERHCVSTKLIAEDRSVKDPPARP